MWEFRSTLWLVSPVADDLQTTRQSRQTVRRSVHLQVRPRITNNCLNFPSMADNPGVLYQSFDILFLHCGNLHRIELMKAGAIVFRVF